MTPEKICAVNEDEVHLKCHSFLSIYMTKVWYGRNESIERVICDGDKPNDNQKPFSNPNDEYAPTTPQRKESIRCPIRCTWLT